MKSELIHLPILDYYAIVNFFGSQTHLDDVPIEKLLGEAILSLSSSINVLDTPKIRRGLFRKHTVMDLLIDAIYVNAIEKNIGARTEGVSSDLERLASYFANLPDYRKNEIMGYKNPQK